MSRKIEVGCLVILVAARKKPEQNGLCFTVVARNKNAEKYRSDRCWWLDDGDWTQERHLLRIDDYNEETETQEEELTV